MDDAAVATPFGSWASIRGYFTPATLFLVLNLVIGTIALTSRSHQRRRREHDYAHDHHQAHYHEAAPFDTHQQQEYHYYQQQPLARTSSVLDRLRSIGLYRFRSGDFPPEYAAGAASHHDAFPPVVEEETAKQYSRSRSEPAPEREERRAPPQRKKKPGTDVVRKSQAARAPAAMVVQEAVAEDARAQEDFVGGLSLRQHEPASPPKAEHHYHYQEEEEEEEEYVPPPAPIRAPPPLSRTSSVLERLRSLGLYSFLGAEQPATAPEADAAFPAAAPAVSDKKQTQSHAHYDRSRSEPAREQGKKERMKQAAETKMTKSSSTARKPAAAPRLAQQQSINTRADAFIDSFRREQSQRQLVHHHEEEEDDDERVVPPPLARTSSVLDRLRSFGMYLRSGDPLPEDPYNNKAAPSAADEKKQAAAQYGRSRSEPAREQGKAKKKQEARMSKVSSEADMAEEASAEECVDARADDFINRFRQQLQLQRLNSLLNYKEALNRKQ